MKSILNKFKIILLSLSAMFLSNVSIGSPALRSFSVDMRNFSLDGKRHLVVSTRLSSPNDPWLVYMPGSGDKLSKIEKIETLQILTAYRPYNVLFINKVGIELDDKVHSNDDFQHGSIRSQRIQDNLTVMKKLIPADASILLVSLSEGAYISPEVAQSDSRVKGLILLSGNSWSWLEEEVMYLPIEKRQERRDFLKNVVVANPVFDKFYGDFWSYAYFASYDTDLTYKTLQKLELPILAINGEKDEVLWLDGAILNLRKLIDKEGKSNIEFHLIADANHSLKCPKYEVCDKKKVFQTLKQTLEPFADRIFD